MVQTLIILYCTDGLINKEWGDHLYWHFQTVFDG